MKKLETEFTYKGWNHLQVFREDNIAIYQRQKEGVRSPHYEVVRVKSHNGFQIPGCERSEPAEYYPPDRLWGIDGFTFPELSDATAKAKELLSQREA
jgi:hypothetical protein